LAFLAHHAHLFDDERASFFGVSADPNDAAQGRIAQRIPGIRWFLDYDLAVSRLYHAVQGAGGEANYLPYWLLLDSTMRVVTHAPIHQADRMFAALEAMIAAEPEQSHAPVLTVPRVLEPELCRELIRLYDAHGGEDSGFMRTHEGKTVPIVDHAFKRRSDYHIADAALRTMLIDRFRRRLIPQIVRAFHYQPTRIERWMVGCYEAERGGFFRAHRDNTTAGTAHRVFACTINLNAEEYEGGELRFPEYGPRTYRAPTGGAVIFSCSLLHEAMPVTRGRRYALLPFFYDEQKARLREANQVHLAGGGTYRADPGEPAAGAPEQDRPQP
jgi:predicted 2-oxoglutarate/Fe(II)-dependent dioxygenase YbiX